MRKEISRQPNSKHRVISDDCENECLRPELVIRRSGYCMCWKRCLSTWMIRTGVFWMT